jgi:hypothetical protein
MPMPTAFTKTKTKSISSLCVRGALIVLVTWSCATPGAATRKYPPRPAGCELSFYSTPVPGVAAWDDLGVAEAACNINESTSECVRGLRAEACRMGGDIVYNVPRKPLRPRDQVLLYRGLVAHSRAATITPKPTLPEPSASEADSARPVVPLGAAEPALAPPSAEAALPPGLDLRVRPARALAPATTTPPAQPSAGDGGVDAVGAKSESPQAGARG